MTYLRGLDLATVYKSALDGHLRLLAALEREIERADMLLDKFRGPYPSSMNTDFHCLKQSRITTLST
jgi:hypothetical protein